MIHHQNYFNFIFLSCSSNDLGWNVWPVRPDMSSSTTAYYCSSTVVVVLVDHTLVVWFFCISNNV